VTTEAEAYTLTQAGWPRPIIDGFPIPWVSPAEALGITNGDRILATKADRLCQVCGGPLDSESVVFVDGGRKSKRRHADVDFTEVLCRAMDDAVMHPRCARLAAGRCPRLRQLQREERFMAYIGPTSKIGEYDADESEHDPERPQTLTFMALEGTAARIFDLIPGVAP
jgi:hypothetical protein